MDLRGFEPLTPCMPCRCATNCATDPHGSRANARPTTLLFYTSPDHAKQIDAPGTGTNYWAATSIIDAVSMTGESCHSRSSW